MHVHMYICMHLQIINITFLLAPYQNKGAQKTLKFILKTVTTKTYLRWSQYKSMGVYVKSILIADRPYFLTCRKLNPRTNQKSDYNIVCLRESFLQQFWGWESSLYGPNSLTRIWLKPFLKILTQQTKRANSNLKYSAQKMYC
jgi:hypothetical protein